MFTVTKVPNKIKLKVARIQMLKQKLEKLSMDYKRLTCTKNSALVYEFVLAGCHNKVKKAIAVFLSVWQR